MPPVITQHIEMRPSAIHGQKACIAGTRISVQDIYVWHELMGKSPDQIASEYPFLTLAQVHSALAYYYDNAEEIREQCKAVFGVTRKPVPSEDEVKAAQGILYVACAQS